ncbi:MAG: CocE/NonD family hydrolase [Dehalococcoidales bacterium]|nr:CocE/NonD family hydrolase [Dehalococcoidales bacterium]
MSNKRYKIRYPNPQPDSVKLESNVSVVMRDGIKMAVDIYKPSKGTGPWPVILAYSPFQKERSFESAKPAFYCAHGYVCVQASERGIGFNQGKFDMSSPVAARDGYDLIEWLAARRWCNGNVGMMGASGYGVAQWITAPLNPPHLKALVVLATTDNYRGLCYPGGVLRKPFVSYLVPGFTQAALWPGPIPGKEPPSNILGKILAHTQDGPFWWNHGSGWKTISKIKAPVLNIMNTPNRLHTMSHLRSYSEIKSPRKLIITPWTNENYQPWIFETTSFNEYILRWLDYWLKGIDTGIMDEPEVAIYDNGTGEWRFENEYPLARASWNQYYLHSPQKKNSGTINNIPPAATEKENIFYNISLNTALMTSYGKSAVTRSSERPNYVTYVSPPLDEDLRVWGPVSLTLYAATAEEITTDWSFFVKLGEMVPEGVPLNPVTGLAEIKPEASDSLVPDEVQIWSFGNLKAKFRELDENLSSPGIPWHPFKNPEDLKPDTVYEFQIELQPIFKTFKKGCRLWLKIACDDALYSPWDNTSLYVETPSVPENSEITIYCNDRCPSHLALPIIPDAEEIAPVPSTLRDAVPGAPRFTT